MFFAQVCSGRWGMSNEHLERFVTSALACVHHMENAGFWVRQNDEIRIFLGNLEEITVSVT